MVAVAAAMSSAIPPRGGKMSMAACTDYGCPVRFFVPHIPNCLADWGDWPNYIFEGIFGSIFSTTFVTVHHLIFHYSVVFSK